MGTVMKRTILWLRRLGAFAVAAVLIAPAALAQDSVVTSTSNTSVTTSTTSEFVSDWRLWALVGAVILVIIIIALTRRGGGDTTTIVK
jgi:hypothetical protein